MVSTRLQTSRVDRLIRQSGAFRVSAGAVDALNDILCEYATGVASYAVKIAEVAGRKTVKDTDILLAIKQI